MTSDRFPSTMEGWLGVSVCQQNPVANGHPPGFSGWVAFFGTCFALALIVHIWLELVALGRWRRRRRQRDPIDPAAHPPLVSARATLSPRTRAPTPVDPESLDPLQRRPQRRRTEPIPFWSGWILTAFVIVAICALPQHGESLWEALRVREAGAAGDVEATFAVTLFCFFGLLFFCSPIVDRVIARYTRGVQPSS